MNPLFFSAVKPKKRIARFRYFELRILNILKSGNVKTKVKADKQG